LRELELVPLSTQSKGEKLGPCAQFFGVGRVGQVAARCAESPLNFVLVERCARRVELRDYFFDRERDYQFASHVASLLIDIERAIGAE
jgi:hypothetical protein